MRGGIVKIQLPQDPTGCGRWKRRVQRCRGMGIQMVQHHTDDRGLRQVGLNQVFHTVCKVLSRASVSDLDVAPAPQRFKEHKQVTRPLAALFVVVAPGLASRGWQTSLAN
jgi:hypothetical protein